MYYAVVDLEMCKVPRGSDFHYGSEIIQIGAALIRDTWTEEPPEDQRDDKDRKVILDTFSRYVKPEYGRLDRYIHRLTGISEEDLTDAPLLKDALEEFLGWLPEVPDGELLMVSWSETDLKQFTREMELKGIPVSDKFQWLMEHWIDCQPQFSEKMGMHRSYSLVEALAATGVYIEGRSHNGLVDACDTALLYDKMQREEKLILNPDYARAHDDTAPEHLKDNPFERLLKEMGLLDEEDP